MAAAAEAAASTARTGTFAARASRRQSSNSGVAAITRPSSADNFTATWPKAVFTLALDRASTVRPRGKVRRPMVVEFSKKARATASAPSGVASADTVSAGPPLLHQDGRAPGIQGPRFQQGSQQRLVQLRVHVVDVALQQQRLGR